MAHLVDTSVLARLANTADPLHAVAARAVLELHRRGEVLHITAQNLVEFRNMATRPKAVNGLGLSAVDAEIPRISAACSLVKPAKKRSLTSSALRGAWLASLSSASCKARNSAGRSSAATCN